MMNDSEAIAAVKSGGRCDTPTSLRADESSDSWKCTHDYRVIACDYCMDVVECRHCGKQKITSCSFDEDMA